MSVDIRLCFVCSVWNDCVLNTLSHKANNLQMERGHGGTRPRRIEEVLTGKKKNKKNKEHFLSVTPGKTQHPCRLAQRYSTIQSTLMYTKVPKGHRPQRVSAHRWTLELEKLKKNNSVVSLKRNMECKLDAKKKNAWHIQNNKIKYNHLKWQAH